VPERAISGNPVRPGQDVADHHRDADGVGAHIGAVVVPELVVQGEDAALGIERGTNLVALLARVIGADEMLAAVLDPFTGRASRIAATQASTSSGIDFAANAQAAADVGLVDVDR
jgi:hypothetical protein